MKKLLLAGFAFGALNAAAVAADMAPTAPVYTKAPALAPIYDWTGFYLGGNVGYGWGHANNADSFVSPCPVCVIGPATATLSANGSNDFNGVIGGAQIGYNWQVRNSLFGVEADIQASSEKGTNSINSAFVLPIAFFLPTPLTSSPVALTNTTKLDWFGTVRGRFGYVVDRWVAYGTGGLAYGEANVSSAASPATIVAGFPNVPFNVGSTTTRIGWTLGVGVENALSVNWSWKVEYLYVDLGSVTVTGAVPAQGCLGNALACNPTSAGTTTYAVGRITDNVVRFGINYKY
jgi:outer membrane immunogenic protein